MNEVYGGGFEEDIKSFSKLKQFTSTRTCSHAWNSHKQKL